MNVTVSSRGASQQRASRSVRRTAAVSPETPERREDDRRQRVRAEVEPRDDPEVAAAAAQRPQQVGVRGIRHLEHIAGRRHDLRAHELIGGEPPRADHPADAPAQGQPADADRGRVARAHARGRARRARARPRPTSLPRPRARAVPSTSTPWSAERSIVRPPGTVPHALWPPPRTMTGVPDAAPSGRRRCTSSTERTRTTASGSPMPEWKSRAASHRRRPGDTTTSGSADRRSSRVMASR